MPWRILLILVVMLCFWPGQGEALKTKHALPYPKFRLWEGTRLKGRHFGFQVEGDPFKSYMSVHLDLKRRKPINRSERSKPDSLGMAQLMQTEDTVQQTKQEIHFYRKLLLQSLKPGYILFEVDYYPITHIGTTFFEGEDSRFRLISSGYDQFFAYSFFLGELLFFFSRDPGQKIPPQTGGAMAGFLLTISNWRVSQNKAYRDDWFNAQWKLMGFNTSGPRNLRWRVAAGFTVHTKSRFQNALTLEIFRSRSNRLFKKWSLVENARFSYAVEIPIDPNIDYQSINDFFRLHRLTYGKFFPLGRNGKIMVEVTVGFAWERVKEFDKNDPQRFIGFKENFQLIISPNIRF